MTNCRQSNFTQLNLTHRPMETMEWKWKALHNLRLCKTICCTARIVCYKACGHLLTYFRTSYNFNSNPSSLLCNLPQHTKAAAQRPVPTTVPTTNSADPFTSLNPMPYCLPQLQYEKEPENTTWANSEQHLPSQTGLQQQADNEETCMPLLTNQANKLPRKQCSVVFVPAAEGTPVLTKNGDNNGEFTKVASKKKSIIRAPAMAFASPNLFAVLNTQATARKVNMDQCLT